MATGHYAPDLSVPYLSFGGYSETGGMARFTRMNNPDLLRNIATPHIPHWNADARYFSDLDWAALETRRAASAQRLASARDLLPAQARNREFHRSAFAAADGLAAFAAALPTNDQLEQPERYQGANHNYYSDLRRQARLTVLAFKTGVAVSADLWLGGFDTHAYHDRDHDWLLGNLTGAVDFLWDYAEEHGIADRLVVVMGSDFGRTNAYNAKYGKDHWPIGSYVIMEKNQPWTNRVVGSTDERHFASGSTPQPSKATTEAARSSTPSTSTRRYAAISGSSVPPVRCASRSTTPKTSRSSARLPEQA